jgi:hypothetical protein
MQPHIQLAKKMGKKLAGSKVLQAALQFIEAKSEVVWRRKQ